jgi:hypothetical protein
MADKLCASLILLRMYIACNIKPPQESEENHACPRVLFMMLGLAFDRSSLNDKMNLQSQHLLILFGFSGTNLRLQSSGDIYVQSIYCSVNEIEGYR